MVSYILLKNVLDVIDICVEANYFGVGLGEILRGQLINGGIVLYPKSNDKMFGVTYKFNSNTMYIDIAYFTKNLLIYDFKGIRRKITDRAPIKDIIGSNLMKTFGSIFYYGVLLFNRYNRGELTKFEDVRRWYLEFMFRTIYAGTGGLTTVSKKASVLWYNRFLNVILEIIELPTYQGYIFDKSDIKKLRYHLYKIHVDVLKVLEDSEIDQPGIDAYKMWFHNFCLEYEKCFKLQNKRTGELTTDLFKYELKFEVITYESLVIPYSRLCPLVSVSENRLPSPILRELFITAEPLAQAVFSSFALNPKSKIKNSMEWQRNMTKEWQKIVAKGLSFLTPT